jgi:hypothetical protein
VRVHTVRPGHHVRADVDLDEVQNLGGSFWVLRELLPLLVHRHVRFIRTVDQRSSGGRWQRTSVLRHSQNNRWDTLLARPLSALFLRAEQRLGQPGFSLSP